MVTDDDVCHGFYNGDCSGEDAGIMSAASLEECFLMFCGDGGLLTHDGGGGLECDTKDDVFTVGNTALDAT